MRNFYGHGMAGQYKKINAQREMLKRNEIQYILTISLSTPFRKSNVMTF